MYYQATFDAANGNVAAHPVAFTSGLNSSFVTGGAIGTVIITGNAVMDIALTDIYGAITSLSVDTSISNNSVRETIFVNQVVNLAVTITSGSTGTVEFRMVW